jgi:hypothetical protein
MDRSIVGDLINFRGLVYSPTNEQGVVFLFGKVAGDLNMYVEEVKTGFPDCIGRRFTGKGWERLAIEFEFCSLEFKNHKHDHTRCDLIVCWEHNWPDCPIEVIELRQIIESLPNEAIRRPEFTSRGYDLVEVMKQQKVNDTARLLFEKLDAEILGLDERVFRRVRKGGVTYYSPERAFAGTWLRTDNLFVELFTGGKRDDDVGAFSTSPLWGHVRVRDDQTRARALELTSSSLQLVREAIKSNRPTGYTTPLEAVEAAEEEEESSTSTSGPDSQ